MTTGSALQRVLARLLVDPDALQSFVADPSGLEKIYGLSLDDLEVLRSLGAGPIKEFGETLRRKRLSLLRRFFPSSVEVLRLAQLESVLTSYGTTNAPLAESPEEITTKAIEDFARYLVEVGPVQDLPFMQDLVAYEFFRVRLANSHAASHWAVECSRSAKAFLTRNAQSQEADIFPLLGMNAVTKTFAFDVVSISREVREDLAMPTVLPHLTYVLMYKRSGKIGVNVRRLGKGTFCMFNLCNGRHRLQTIYESIASAFPGTKMSELDGVIRDGLREGIIFPLSDPSGEVFSREP